MKKVMRHIQTGIQDAYYLTTCVWDAAPIAFERQAWVDTMLNNPNGPSIEQYLSTPMNEDV